MSAFNSTIAIEGNVIPATASSTTGDALQEPVQVHYTGSETSSESDPLLPTPGPGTKRRKHWYRPRPLWLVPFAIGACISRGMTLAPRVEVFTQIACDHLRPVYENHTAISEYSGYHDNHSLSPLFVNSSIGVSVDPAEPLPKPPYGHEEGPKTDSSFSRRCNKDPQVKAYASRLVTVFTTTMGVLCALTTGWWGRFGERHGRLKVLTSCVLGLLLTDLSFLIASSRILDLGKHRSTLLITASAIEGLLGGYATLQATTTAYISDCTSDGSRANIFSRFTGVFFIGIAVGPEVGALLIKHTNTITVVFTASICLWIVNLMLCALVFPESMTAARREELRSKRLATAGNVGVVRKGWKRWFTYPLELAAPLAVFLPRKREHRRGLDWNFPLLAAALFCYLLTVGMYQTKYLYATTTYDWGAEQLSYYITLIGTSRAVHLLLILPYIIRSFKPTRPESIKNSPEYPKLLAKEMRFDIAVAKCSLVLDVLSHATVTALDPSNMELFVGASLLTSLGGGALPSLQSLAICVSQVHEDEGGMGELFGAISFLSAVGSMIVGPLLYGLVFSATVGVFPKAIFVTAATVLACGFTFLSFMRPNRRLEAIQRARDEQHRGRSRASKGLRIA